jgi:hypothetical protein
MAISSLIWILICRLFQDFQIVKIEDEPFCYQFYKTYKGLTPFYGGLMEISS